MATSSALLVIFVVCICIVSAQIPVPSSIGPAVTLPTTTSSVESYGDVLMFPQDPTPTKYFSNKLDFVSINGSLLVGAADTLYLLDNDLNVLDTLTWINPSQPGTCDFDNAEYICRNHIRVYESIPGGVGGVPALLVCGTIPSSNSFLTRSISAQCRTVTIVNSRFGKVSNVSDDVEGLITVHPDLPGFGEFRRSSENDTTYLSASFTTPNIRDYDLAYLDVTVNSSTAVPSAVRDYGYLTFRNFWLYFPVVFVDYKRENYPRPPGSTNDAAFQFYYVFLRENFQIDNREVLYSRVIRICRNDPGVTSTSQNREQIFSTYLKSRIYCLREMPTGTEFIGAQDFQYNEMWSLSFNKDEGGRYYSDGQYNKYLYAAFSGPLVGPTGTAVCVYPAFPAHPTGQNTLNDGIFDIFQGDLVITTPSQGGNTERQNTLVECFPQGRNVSGDAEDILLVKDIEQLGDDPLIVLDGLHVTQLLVDEVCVVTKTDPTSCRNQDVLFLGTDNGMVYKVIMATVTSGLTGKVEPVIVDKIQLGDSLSVDEMQLKRVDNGDKQLFVTTASRVYRLPLENCNRHGANFSACIGSRDPYCVWDSVTVSCVKSTLTAVDSAAGSVPSALRQNIHTGQDTVPVVWFAQTQLVVGEGDGPLSVVIMSDIRVSDNVLELIIEDGTATAGLDFVVPSTIVNFPSNQNLTTVTIMIIPRAMSTGNLQFSLRMRSSGSGALEFRNRSVIITIVDEQAVLFQLTIGGLGTRTCQQWIQFEPSNKIAAITADLLDAFIPSAKPEDYEDTFVQSSFTCADKLSTDYKEFAIFRSSIDVSKLNTIRTEVLSSLDNWVRKQPTVTYGESTLTVLTDSNCDTVLNSLDQPLCAYDGITVGDPAGVLSPNTGAETTTVLGVVVGFAFAVMIGLVLVVVVLVGVMFMSRRARQRKSNDVTDGPSPKKQNNASNPNGPPSALPLIPEENPFNFNIPNQSNEDTDHEVVAKL